MQCSRQFHLPNVFDPIFLLFLSGCWHAINCVLACNQWNECLHTFTLWQPDHVLGLGTRHCTPGYSRTGGFCFISLQVYVVVRWWNLHYRLLLLKFAPLCNHCLSAIAECHETSMSPPPPSTAGRTGSEFTDLLLLSRRSPSCKLWWHRCWWNRAQSIASCCGHGPLVPGCSPVGWYPSAPCPVTK